MFPDHTNLNEKENKALRNAIFSIQKEINILKKPSDTY